MIPGQEILIGIYVSLLPTSLRRRCFVFVFVYNSRQDTSVSLPSVVTAVSESCNVPRISCQKARVESEELQRAQLSTINRPWTEMKNAKGCYKYSQRPGRFVASSSRCRTNNIEHTQRGRFVGCRYRCQRCDVPRKRKKLLPLPRAKHSGLLILVNSSSSYDAAVANSSCASSIA